MEVFLIKALQLILCFAILIILHEGGHFFFAKLFGVRVEKFCLFFDPWKSWKVFSFKGTDYHIGWLPLGGYVNISGMVDESTKAADLDKTVHEWEFRAKPAWQRLLIMLGGVLVNFFLALFIYAMILFTWGDTYIPIEKIEHGFSFSEEAKSYGFRNGDILLGTGQKDFKRFTANCYRYISEAKEVRVKRDGKEVTISLPGNLNLLNMIQEQPPFVEILYPAIIDSIKPGSPAQKAGLLPGDKVVAYNGRPISTWNEFNVEIGKLHDRLATASHKDSTLLRKATLAVIHKGKTDADTLRLVLNSNYEMGFYKHNILTDYQQVTQNYNIISCFPAGCKHGWNVLCGYVDDLKYIFTAEGAKSVGSFGAIGNLFPAQWDWARFWELTAFISLMLAFMNILPIPALDGGHALFLLVEVITRKKPSDKFMEKAQIIGMTLLFLLMAYAIFNDIMKFVF